MQRILDIFFSGLALLILSPLLVPIAIVLRFSGEGEIFYLQERVGYKGKIFKLFKFATMLKNSPSIGTGTVTVKADPRVLPVGKFLRKTKINELPQLLNIFLGEMSIVGPRPQTPRCFAAFSPLAQDVIKEVKPGLSGIGSIIFRGEEDILADNNSSLEFYDQVIAPYKGLLEEWYVKNQNIYTYLKVIWVTAWIVFFPKSRLGWLMFSGLPVPPDVLVKSLNY